MTSWRLGRVSLGSGKEAREVAIEILVELADPARRTELPALAESLRRSAAIPGTIKVLWSAPDRDRLGPLPEAMSVTIAAKGGPGAGRLTVRAVIRVLLDRLAASGVELYVRQDDRKARLFLPASGDAESAAHPLGTDLLDAVIDQAVAQVREHDEPAERTRWTPGSLLDSLSPADRQTLLRLGRRRQYGPGSRLLAEGDLTTFAIIILDGYVKISAVTESGTESLLAIRTAGDVIGELAALDESPRSATAVAAGAVLARVLTKAELDDCFRRNPAIAVGFNRAVAAKLRTATRHRVDFRGRDAKERLARALLELFCDPAGPPGHAQQGLLFTQAELAGLIGVSESTVHKALRDLREAGAVDTSYRHLTITDTDALRQIAADAG
jgi:CRP/FNR family cyclic AMP-dependent transcriptional regulator